MLGDAGDEVHVIDVLMLVAYVALPLASWLVSRSMTRLVIAFSLMITILGSGIQTSIAFGFDWNYRGVQLLLLLGLIAVLAYCWTHRTPTEASVRRQAIVVLGPVIVVGAFLVLLRLVAPEHPGPLTAVGWLFNFTSAEDNAKWLHLASQLSSGRDLAFTGGYAGGPMLMVLTGVATLISVLSMILLGGVNEVAVAANTVVGSYFIFLAAAPFAFAPLVEAIVPRGRRRDGTARGPIPAPLIWVGMVTLIMGSAVLFEYGHLSLQFVLMTLVTWVAVFLVGSRVRSSHLAASLVIVGAAGVWLPLNMLSAAILAAAFIFVGFGVVQSLRGRRRLPWGQALLVLATAIAVWDPLISSTYYSLGLGGGDASASGAADVVLGGAARGVAAVAHIGADAMTLFTSGGGTEVTGPITGLLTVALTVSAAVYLGRGSWGQRRLLLAFAPILTLVVYITGLALADSLLTGEGPHYATHKMAYAVTMSILPAVIPVGLMMIEPARAGMTIARWLAVGGVIYLLIVDSIIPRAASNISPAKWPAVSAEKPQIWSVAEVKNRPDQPLSNSPIACVYLAPGATEPSGQPDGQTTYACTRLMIGLSGLEGTAASLQQWIGTDWLSNGKFWWDWYPPMSGMVEEVRRKPVILLNDQKELVGIETFQSLLDRFPPERRPASG